LLNKPVLIENQETRRYLFCDGEPIKGNRGDEGGWAASSGFESPKVVGADANYYNRALWTIVPNGDAFLIENQETKRYLFCDGEPIKGNRGDEGGWLGSSGFESPKVVGADANYYNRALWTITLGIDTQPVESTKAELDVVKQSSQPASASPNISPSASPVSPEQFIPLEQSGTLPEPASASPNVAPSPLLPIEPTEPSPSATPAAAIAPPIPPVKLPGRQMVLVLDEKHQGISAGSGALRPQGQFTIEAWVYPATNAGKQVIFADGETLFYLEGGELKFHTPLSSEAIASVGAGITSGSWYHVAVPRAGSRPGETKLYINGVHNDNQKAISPVVSFGNTYLGGQPDVPDSRFQGKLLEVRVWRYARSLADIEANRLYPMTGRELGLVRCWSLNQTVESTLHDKTTNRAVGTLSSNAVWEEVEIPLKLKLDPQERLTRSTGLEDYGYWYKEMAKQHKTEADPPFRRGRIWA
ncbi:MAG: LamG-like jellyroll fold domain-containing protein, partial [Nostoc sp.]